MAEKGKGQHVGEFLLELLEKEGGLPIGPAIINMLDGAVGDDYVLPLCPFIAGAVTEDRISLSVADQEQMRQLNILLKFLAKGMSQILQSVEIKKDGAVSLKEAPES